MRIFIFVIIILISFDLVAQLSPVYDSIPMRDGKKLAATIYQPSGCSSCPTILIQTPYNRLLFNIVGLPLNVGYNINSFNYNVVIVDWRGFYGSFSAAYSGSPTRGQDGYDAVEWIAVQSWSNGQVGTWGPSALGKCQFQTAQENPPHLICMVPLVAAPQFNYQEYYPGGVYRTEYVEQLDALGYGMSAALLSFPVYNLYWSSVENANFYPDSIRVPTFMIGGWYDHNTELMLQFYNAIRSTSTGVENEHRLLMGPWVHGGSGIASVGSATQGELSYPNAADWNDSLALLFFDYHLRGISNGWDTTPFITYYQMGENNWSTSSVWPPTGLNSVNLYLHTDSSMNTGIPSLGTGSLNFSYDPLNPSPTVGGCTLRSDLDQGPYDQVTLIESRSDVLSFSTVTLGTNVVMKGNVQVHLKVASNKKDTDFAVRLTDVYPDGRSMLLVDGIYRMRFRDGFYAIDTNVMVPGNIYDVVVDMPTSCITFLAGHKIRLDISSSNYPKYNRNDNSGGVMYPALNGDSLKNPTVALNTVYTNNINASYITLPLVDFVGGEFNIEKSNIEIAIYPIPVKNTLTIELKEGEIMEVKIIDMFGKNLAQKKYNSGKVQCDMEKFVSGIYLLHCITDKGIVNKKIIIE